MFVVAGKYHVIAPRGSGGMGAVYEAVHAGTGRRVAVKMLRHEIATHERARERFVREARVVGALDSPHVADVLDAGTDEVSGLPYLVMELLDGPSLYGVVHERGALPVGLALVVGAQIARGLADAHASGIIHRDVKPANVVLCEGRSGELVAKLVDFGVAKALEDGDEGLTKTGELVGSLAYMAPEQLVGGAATAQSDLWSLGAVLYEALSGKRISDDAEPIAQLVRRTTEGGVSSLRAVAPWVPAHVAAVVERALAGPPEARFPSAQAMHDAIAMLLPEGTRVPASALRDGSKIPVARARAPRRPARRPAVAVAVAAGAFAVLLGAIAIQAQPHRGSTPPVTPVPVPAVPMTSAPADRRPPPAPAPPSPSAAPAEDEGEPPLARPEPPRPARARPAHAGSPLTASRPAPPAAPPPSPPPRPVDPLDHM